MGVRHENDARSADAPRFQVPVWAVLAVIVPVAVATLAALVWLWPSNPAPDGQTPDERSRVTGTVLQVDQEPCAKQPVAPVPDARGPGGGTAPPTDPRRCGTAIVKLTSGSMAGRSLTVDLPSGPGVQVFSAGEDVVLVHTRGFADGSSYLLVDHDRSNALWLVAAAFALAVIAFGRWRGLSALAGLAVTFALLLLFLIPAILAGESPLLAAVVCASAIMLAVLYLTHGFTVPTSIAVIGTLGSLALTGLLALAAIRLTHLYGITDDSSFFLDLNYQINTRGLLLAGIIIGSLGVLDDITVTQAVTVAELARANPSYDFAALYRAATRVGRAHIASVINTIILAYAGAALPLLLLFRIGNQPVSDVLTNPAVAQEIVRCAAGTLGLVAAVPLTTALAALAITRRTTTTEPKPPPATGAEPAKALPEPESADRS